MARLSAKERKGRIVEAAIRHFSEAGFHGTTTRELARKAGISEALLFRHFPDKESLYEAILQKKMGEHVPLFLSDLPLDRGPQDVLKTLARRIVALNQSDHSFLRLLLFSALENHELSRLFFRKRTLPLVDFLSGYFEKLAREKALKKIAPRPTAFAFMAMVFGYVQTRILFKIPEIVKKSSEEWPDRYVDIFLKGILP